VIKLPRWLWLPILHGVVLNTRPAKSAEKYRQIWTPEGSPLAIHTARQAKLLAEKTGRPVAYAMRYGEPGIASSLAKLRNALVVPLYPQYSESATASVADVLPPRIPMVDHFYNHPRAVAALAANVRRHWQQHGRGTVLLMSFHGLPKSQAFPYEGHCRTTAQLLAKALGLKDEEWLLTFQSRFGFAEWLQPYTEATLKTLGHRGLKRVDVVCPGFVSDCLETLEEINIGAREAFLHAGGEAFRYIPCLNEMPEWIEALASISDRSSS